MDKDKDINEFMNNYFNKMETTALETQEEFIFETVRPYCEEITQTKISKKDLQRALLIWMKLKEYGQMGIDLAVMYAQNIALYGIDITEKWQNAVENHVALSKAYHKGYYDAFERMSEKQE